MNHQQMQQIRTIAQEQFQPFLQQHKILIDELSNKINNSDSDKINRIIEQENKIKHELQEENNILREIAEDQKNNFAKQQKHLNEQVETLLNQFGEGIQPILADLSKRIDKLEKGEINVSLPAKEIASAIENYYQTMIKTTSVSITVSSSDLLNLKAKKKEYDNLQKNGKKQNNV